MITARMAFGAALAFALSASPAFATANEEHPHGSAAKSESGTHSHEKSEMNGGHATMTEAHHFETVFGKDGIRIYVYSDDQKPMAVGKAVGAVTLKWKDGATREVPLVVKTAKAGEAAVYYCPMGAEFVGKEAGRCPKCGMDLVAQDYLFAAADLSKAEPGSLKAVLRVTGLAGDEQEATFTETYRGVMEPPAAHKETTSHSHTH